MQHEVCLSDLQVSEVHWGATTVCVAAVAGACIAGKVEAVNLLLQRGADVHALGNFSLQVGNNSITHLYTTIPGMVALGQRGRGCDIIT